METRETIPVRCAAECVCVCVCVCNDDFTLVR